MDEVAIAEREKYLTVWESPDYRRNSPGMLEVKRAFSLCCMKMGETLIDFGSGPCRATKWFQDQGLHVLAIDFAPNARETEVPFIEACLWDIPESVKAHDYGFCTDVMEHIPEEKVDAVLESVACLTRQAAYFRVATRPDVFGPRLLGKPLHVTVKPGDWWYLRAKAHFYSIEVVLKKERDIVFIGRV